jgi:hypothetical protein
MSRSRICWRLTEATRVGRCFKRFRAKTDRVIGNWIRRVYRLKTDFVKGATRYRVCSRVAMTENRQDRQSALII